MQKPLNPAIDRIIIRGARQNNLKGLDVELPLGKLIVITGVSGSGKSSLAFDTVYSEGQRRYVETFSPYTRQFLDRMDKPAVDSIEGIPPAIAIDQTNPVRTSRSTVGTMTELNDHLKLLYARAALLFCGGCGREVRRDTPETVGKHLAAERKAGRIGERIVVAFPVNVPSNFTESEVLEALKAQGYQRILEKSGNTLEVIQDRLKLSGRSARLVSDIETAMSLGRGRVDIFEVDEAMEILARYRFSSDLHCPDCDIHYAEPKPSMFSFNSPIGACETCRGFGRTIGIDYGMVIPDQEKTLAGGAVKPWQTKSYRESQDDMMKFAQMRGIPTDVPWRDLGDRTRRWVIDGEGSWEDGLWYGARRYFEWLEGRSYRMHIRVLLSKYRSYDTCPACRGARLKPEALLWRLGGSGGYDIHALTLLPITECLDFVSALAKTGTFDPAAALVLDEIRTRLGYLVDVGLGYLTLDRQSRTLSGGEVQRINLTTALGTSLVNTLFVLDEPSIGLHHRDVKRLIRILKRLEETGNSLIVVEHDPAVIEAADLVIDMGPGAGEAGGRIVYYGDYPGLVASKTSLTGRYLSGELSVTGNPDRAVRSPKESGTPGAIVISGAAEHNMAGIDVTIPLGRLVCVSGVSGSGKSTLIQDILYRALLREMGKPTETPGAFSRISGHESITDVVLVDQSPIGKTARSNPVSYIGAYGAIRNLFAEHPLSIERGYTAGTFSFNSGTGRCPACKGTGFEHVEMQFLSDVYIRCPECDGRRFRPEILEVRIQPDEGGEPASVADVLDMTVTDACVFFARHPKVAAGLSPLLGVGLGYLRLGQPVPTLSGGEAQRLKLAAYLGKGNTSGAGSGRILFLLDEPTTGLHFEDVSVLLSALGRLRDSGHSLIVIEHNLDVLAAADWIIDLGPEGGQGGGRIVAEGPPAVVAKTRGSHTGKALKALRRAPSAVGSAAHAAEGNPAYVPDRSIVIRHAREHNLKNLTVSIPRDSLTVITGVSGSGKSTVAFDILFGEGQRRYLESLNAYARQFVQPSARPDVDSVTGVPPTVAIEQRTSRGGRKSTVGTITEIHQFMRLLFVKLGTQYCPSCDIPIKPQSRESILSSVMKEFRGKPVDLFAPLVTARKGYYTDLAAWAAAKGYAALRVDGGLLPVDPWPRLDRYREHDIELPIGTVVVTPSAERIVAELITAGIGLGNGTIIVSEGGTDRLYSTLRSCPGCGRSFPELDPRLFSYNSKHGWCPKCYGTGLEMAGFDEEQTGEEHWWNDWWEGTAKTCRSCGGKRLREEALSVLFSGRTIAGYSSLSVSDALGLFSTLELDSREREIAQDVIPEIIAKLTFLAEVGLPYLSLDRAAPTLSGGEAQRIRLASQLGSNLRGVCYILDEPTIGLHPRDNAMLLATLKNLRSKGNTVVVVEHDEATIRSADHVIDLGPGGGTLGGRLMFHGTVSEMLESDKSLTGRYLRSPLTHPISVRRTVEQAGGSGFLTVREPSLHNMRAPSVELPLRTLTCVTGVSGSGKSTLVRDIIYENLHARVSSGRRRGRPPKWTGCTGIDGWESLDRILEVDQTPIGKTPRSCPATYVGFMDDLRELFAALPESKMRGYGAARFSFNVSGGRCEECQGQGWKKIEMSFLPDVKVPCESCGGSRYGGETLEIRFKGMNIGDVLAMSMDDAAGFFDFHPRISHSLSLLREVGLGYLTLGQQSPTLSGGEAQRIKLVTELAKSRPDGVGRTLYVLDEPTIGLHAADVEKLVKVLHRLVDAGNSVIVIEHNMDIIAEADWVVDLGPEGGDEGGEVTAAGTPEDVARSAGKSYTAQILSEFLIERKRS